MISVLFILCSAVWQFDSQEFKMKKLNVLEGSAHLRINEVKTIDFSGDSAMSINKQITLIYIWLEDSEKVWKASRKIEVGNFFLKSGSVVIPIAFSAWTFSPNCSTLQGRRGSHSAAHNISLCWNVNKCDLILVKLWKSGRFYLWIIWF